MDIHGRLVNTSGFCLYCFSHQNASYWRSENGIPAHSTPRVPWVRPAAAVNPHVEVVLCTLAAKASKSDLPPCEEQSTSSPRCAGIKCSSDDESTPLVIASAAGLLANPVMWVSLYSVATTGGGRGLSVSWVWWRAFHTLSLWASLVQHSSRR